MDMAGTPHTPHGECPDRAFMSPEGKVVEAFGNGFGCSGLQSNMVCSNLFLTDANYLIKDFFSHYNKGAIN